ncbi:hypothetical protein TNCV_1464201 [Trichonephila clavipes]|nr:hypothetical protein TNCV_1464201 [Trichonephila clavipes]
MSVSTNTKSLNVKSCSGRASQRDGSALNSTASVRYSAFYLWKAATARSKPVIYCLLLGFFPLWNFLRPRGPKWGLAPPPSPYDRNLEFSSSDSEEEANMEAQLAMNMNRSPSPPLAPPSIKTLEGDYQLIENSDSCAGFIRELRELMFNLDSYGFDNAAVKEKYRNGFVKIFRNSTELLERLRCAEQESYAAIISEVDLTCGIPTKANPFKTVKSKKGNRTTPSPPPERHTKKKLKTDEFDTANKYDGLPIEDPPAAVDNEEGNEDIYQDLSPCPEISQTPANHD